MTRIRRPAAQQRVVAGIDQSYSGFAVCFLWNDGTDSMHRRSFPPDKSSGVDRLADIGVWLTDIFDVYVGIIEHVCMEGYAPNVKFGREMSGELGAVVKLALRTSPALRSPACYPTIVAPTKLKSFVCGSQGKKSDMKLYVFKRWGQTFKTDDEADAYGLARLAAAIQWGSEDLLEYQKDVLKNLRHHTELKG